MCEIHKRALSLFKSNHGGIAGTDIIVNDIIPVYHAWSFETCPLKDYEHHTIYTMARQDGLVWCTLRTCFFGLNTQNYFMGCTGAIYFVSLYGCGALAACTGGGTVWLKDASNTSRAVCHKIASRSLHTKKCFKLIRITPKNGGARLQGNEECNAQTFCDVSRAGRPPGGCWVAVGPRMDMCHTTAAAIYILLSFQCYMSER